MAIVSRSASRRRLMMTTGSEGETCSSRPRWAPAGTTRRSSVRDAGVMPRRCMSSVKDVIVSSCAIFGSLTNVPLPWRRTSNPSRTSSSSAARTVSRETPRFVDSWRSEGIASPTPSCSIRSSTWLRVSLCFVPVRLMVKTSSPQMPPVPARCRSPSRARQRARLPSRCRRSGTRPGRRRAPGPHPAARWSADRSAP